MTEYYTEPIFPVPINPNGWPNLGGTEFDPKIHLQIEVPNSVKDLTFHDVSFPFEGKLENGFAYSRPFRVLSDEGVKVARAEFEKHRQFLEVSTERSTFIRGLGYLSKFHRDFSYCPEVVNLLSTLSDVKLQPHAMSMNISHVNVGEVASGKAVDKWHYDSVDYVLIVIISDMTNMVGGELKVLQKPDLTGNLFDELIKTGIPNDFPIESVNYLGAGYGIFMQGSRLLHKVTGVLQASEPRLSLVNSYQTLNPFAQDRTRLSTFLEGDRPDIANLEFARFKAQRISGQMQFILQECKFGMYSPQEMSKLLLNAASELTTAAGILSGDVIENKTWWNETKDENNEHITN